MNLRVETSFFVPFVCFVVNPSHNRTGFGQTARPC